MSSGLGVQFLSPLRVSYPQRTTFLFFLPFLFCRFTLLEIPTALLRHQFLHNMLLYNFLVLYFHHPLFGIAAPEKVQPYQIAPSVKQNYRRRISTLCKPSAKVPLDIGSSKARLGIAGLLFYCDPALDDLTDAGTGLSEIVWFCLTVKR